MTPSLASFASQRWLDPVQGVIAHIANALAQRHIHPAHAMVLLPYAQLIPVASRYWMQVHPQGFAPRFETTVGWSRSLGPPLPSGSDLAFETAHDLLTADDLLERAGLQAHRQLLAERLVEAAQTLGRQVAAVPLAARADWGVQAHSALLQGMDAPVLALELALAQIALAWALASRYASDLLLHGPVPPGAATGMASIAGTSGVACVIVLEGLQREPLLAVDGALAQQWGQRLLRIALVDAPTEPMQWGQWGQLALHPALGAQDEAERAAACVLRHLGAGRSPVALVATDRVLTRRVRAMLDGQGLRLRDENGWKLSTTRAAAQVLCLLRASSWDAGSDAVLDWLKNTPACAPSAVAALEKALRKTACTDWGRWLAHVATLATLATATTVAATTAAPPANHSGSANRSLPTSVRQLTAQAERWRGALQGSRTLAQWLERLRQLLQDTGQWQPLEADPAGAALLMTLRLTAPAPQALALTQGRQRQIDLATFSHWLQAALEAANFVPDHAPDHGADHADAHSAQVVILPLSQLLARPFAAVVLPGCDEKRLPAAPEPPGNWSAAQRHALGLPSRAELQAATQAAWQQALQAPKVDLLWRQSDDGGEPLLPSPLLQAVQLSGLAHQAEDPRSTRSIQPQPTLPPQAQGDALPLQRLSASAYEDLRRCPYRFFALRQLGLSEADELEDEVDKRDFGLWLHAVLKTFHEALAATEATEATKASEAPQTLDAAKPTRLHLIEQAASATTRSMGLSPAAFLPFAAAWPQVRDGYLEWLATHEASGARFGWAERWQELPLGALTVMHGPSTPSDETAPRDEHAASSAPVELAPPGHQVRPLEGEAPQALRGWATFTAPQDERAAPSAPVDLAPPGHQVRPLEGVAPQALRGWDKFTLVGQIDRLDHVRDGSVLVMDYKTEGLAVTRERVKNPTEDTQLAFYAALQPDDTLQAAYINIGEKGGTTPVPQPDVVAVRDALIGGILHDLQRIADGATLAALGEGLACDHCAARGLCRKDFWPDGAARLDAGTAHRSHQGDAP